MRSYEAARNIFSFLGFCAWSVIVLGGILALLAGGAVSNSGFGGPPSELQVMLAATPGLIMAFTGFLILALVQMGRASVDTAEYAQQSLDVSRKQLEISKQALELSRAKQASYQGATPAKSNSAASEPATVSADADVSYANQTSPETPTAENSLEQESQPEIEHKDGKYHVEGKSFWSWADAARHLNKVSDSEPLRAIR